MASSPAPDLRHAGRWALLLWLICCAVMLWMARARFPWLSFRDPDDAMRLAQVRDWLNGQPFRDVMQHRVNPPFGGPMHWSRIVDMPLAGLMIALRPLLGAAGAELIACAVVPLGLLAGLVGALFVMARRLGGLVLALASVALLLTTPSVVIQFTPLRIDHHGWQILLATVALGGAMDPRRRRGGAIAGLAIATWLQISSEALPYAAAFAGAFGLRQWIERDEAPRFAAFAIVLGGGALALLLLLRGPGAMLASQCDALSFVYVWPLVALALAVIAGIRWIGTGTASRRFLIAAMGAGAGGATFLVTGGPCLSGDPFAALGPLAYRLWYLKVSEGRPIWEQSLSMQGVILLPMLLGLSGSIGAAWRAHRAGEGDARAAWLMLALLLAGAGGVSLLVMRAMSVAHVFALPGIAWLILLLFTRAQASLSAPRRIAGSVALVLLTPAGLCALWIAIAAKPDADKTQSGVACRAPEALAPLRALAPATLFAPIDLGPDILVQTRHRVIATAHHRNAAGISAVIKAFVAPPVTARQIVEGTSAAYLVACAGMSEMDAYAKENAGGLAAMLMKGQTPDWLEPVPVTQSTAKGPLRVYRIRSR